MQGAKLTIRYPRKDAEETRVGPHREPGSLEGGRDTDGCAIIPRAQAGPQVPRLSCQHEGVQWSLRGRWPTKTQVLQAPGSSLRGTRAGSLNPGSDEVRWTHSPGCRRAHSSGAWRRLSAPGKSTGPPAHLAAAWVKCAGETQALGQGKWEQLLAGPRGRTPTS